MRINHNISAMNAHRLLNANQTIGAKNLEKLSSGKRINRAGDDAAGMAITEKMRAQIKGLTMASRNSLDGVSLVQTAEGAMGEVHSMLQRMRELSVQAANGTSAKSDREAIQDEINQLTSEINRVSNGTEYNTRNIMKGNEAPNSMTTVQTMSTGKPAIAAGTAAPDFSVNYTVNPLSIEVNGNKVNVNLSGFTDATASAALGKDELLDRINDAIKPDAKAILNDKGYIEVKSIKASGDQVIKITGTGVAGLFGAAVPDAIGLAENPSKQSRGTFYFSELPESGSRLKIGNETIDFYDSSVEPYTGSNRAIDISDGAATPAPKTLKVLVNEIATTIQIDDLYIDVESNLTADVAGSAGPPVVAPKPKAYNTDSVSENRLVITSHKPGYEGNLIALEGTLDAFNTNLQVGANTGQGFRLEIGDIRSKAIRISGDNPNANTGVAGASYYKDPNVTDGISSNMAEYSLDVTDENKATSAITVYNNAIIQVARERSILGATQNRLEHTINNLDNTAENLTAAMSRIEDTDMAKEMSDFQKNNVLQQAGVSMLAQANMLPQSVLKLLG